MHYEIHVTVRTFDIEGFKRRCGEIGVKPIVLDLQTRSGSIEDVMTSSKFQGDDDSVIDELDLIVEGLQDAGFEVVRQKIEAAPWHPLAPQDGTAIPLDGAYFEAHIPIFLTSPNDSSLDKLRVFPDLHLSRNKFKMYDNGSCVQMCTYRRHDIGRKTFENHVEDYANGLLQLGFSLRRNPEIEFCLYDTNVQHDSAWLNS
ncbi:hypothetical protein D3C87_279560 [compost metagenome]